MGKARTPRAMAITGRPHSPPAHLVTLVNPPLPSFTPHPRKMATHRRRVGEQRGDAAPLDPGFEASESARCAVARRRGARSSTSRRLRPLRQRRRSSAPLARRPQSERQCFSPSYGSVPTRRYQQTRRLRTSASHVAQPKPHRRAPPLRQAREIALTRGTGGCAVTLALMPLRTRHRAAPPQRESTERVASSSTSSAPRMSSLPLPLVRR